MEGKVKIGSTFKATNQVDGEIIEHTDKLSIEKLISEANVIKYYVTEGGSQLLSGKYIQALGYHGEGRDINNILDGSFIPLDSVTPATIEFFSACKYDTTVKKTSKRKDIVFRYREQVQSRKIRKEKLAHTAITWDTSNQCSRSNI